jgi:hypothetical protein
MTIHPSLSVSRVTQAVTRGMRDNSYPGFCLACGRRAKQPCEPDATGYTCQFASCGAAAVYGAEAVLLWIVG